MIVVGSVRRRGKLFWLRLQLHKNTGIGVLWAYQFAEAKFNQMILDSQIERILDLCQVRWNKQAMLIN